MTLSEFLKEYDGCFTSDLDLASRAAADLDPSSSPEAAIFHRTAERFLKAHNAFHDLVEATDYEFG